MCVHMLIIHTENTAACHCITRLLACYSLIFAYFIVFSFFVHFFCLKLLDKSSGSRWFDGLLQATIKCKSQSMTHEQNNKMNGLI